MIPCKTTWMPLIGSFLVLGLLLTGLPAFAQVVAPQLTLEPIATGFDDPVDIDHAGDERLFITERDGYIWITDTSGNTLASPFLDIDARVRSSGQEQGLLGLAFAPDYASSGRFYVNYTNNSGTTTISRFRVSGDPNLADPASEEILLSIPQPYSNHNGGCLAFGPDGMLYIGLGDGGLFDDPGNRSQNPLDPLGKMLRLDVSGSTGFVVPPDNPYLGNPDTLDVIWQLGLRNPWRFSFDRETGDLWMGDVGQGDWEEINHQPAASAGGENWGWRCLEGPAPYITGGCAAVDLYDAPVFVYDHVSGGLSVTGGFVYRGAGQFTLAGTDPVVDFAHYLLADYVTGRWWSVQYNGCTGGFESHSLGIVGFDISTFGEDASGELFCANLANGVISRVVDACSRRHPDNLALIEPGDTDTLQLVGQPAGTYTWFYGGFGGVGGCDTLAVTDEAGFTGPFNNGVYITEVAYPDGCKVRYENTALWSGIEAASWAEDWQLMPQPAAHAFQWTVPANNPAAVQNGMVAVVDALGREILSRHIIASGSAFTEAFDTSLWPSGLYLLRWQADVPDASGIRREAARRVLVRH
jgi:hypothetical protein